MIFVFAANFPAIIYLQKANNRNTKKKNEICSSQAKKSLERCWRCSSEFLAHYKYISQFFSCVFIAVFEQVDVCAYFKTFIPNTLFDIKTYFLRQYEKC